MNRLLVGGVAAILIAALAPLAIGSWKENRREQLIEEVRRVEERIVREKEREIACLERLRTSGLRQGMDVQAEIARCRREAAGPEGVSGP
jgi:hypothetical protein